MSLYISKLLYPVSRYPIINIISGYTIFFKDIMLKLYTSKPKLALACSSSSSCSSSDGDEIQEEEGDIYLNNIYSLPPPLKEYDLNEYVKDPRRWVSNLILNSQPDVVNKIKERKLLIRHNEDSYKFHYNGCDLKISDVACIGEKVVSYGTTNYEKRLLFSLLSLRKYALKFDLYEGQCIPIEVIYLILLKMIMQPYPDDCKKIECFNLWENIRSKYKKENMNFIHHCSYPYAFDGRCHNIGYNYFKCRKCDKHFCSQHIYNTNGDTDEKYTCFLCW